MGKTNPNRLLVEGADDQYAVAGLMGAHVQWGESEKDWPVFIKDCKGVKRLLEPDLIPLEFQQRSIRRLGIVVDANESSSVRWDSIRNQCQGLVSDFPKELPPTGVICTNSEGKRLGIWIMPDNRSRGMLETFLQFLIPAADEPLWQYAKDAAKHARTVGAPYKDTHIDSAEIHTWLAWQDEPGPPFGTALKRKCLDPASDRAQPFVEWFKRLFELE